MALRCSVIDIRCPSDGTVYHADESQIGKGIRCEKCGAILRIEKAVYASPVRLEPLPVVGMRPRREAWGTGVFIGVGLAAFFALLVIAFEMRRNPPTVPKQQPASASVPVRSLPPASEREVARASPLPARSHRALLSGKRKSMLSDLVSQSMPAAPPELLPACAAGQEIERPLTGEDLEPRLEATGDCQPTVVNGSSLDAAVRLTDSETGQTICFIYVRSGDSYSILGIGEATASVRFETGTDWVASCRGFTKDQDVQEFDDPVRFSVRTEEDGDWIITHSSQWSLTLNPVFGGNAKTHRIDRNRFFQGDQYVRVAP